MSEHLDIWLDAYLDGQINAEQKSAVEQHLNHCESCRTQFEQRKKLSALLQSVPVPHPSKLEKRFISEMDLQRKPQQAPYSLQSTIINLGWWFVPSGLILISIFLQTTLLLSQLMQFIPGIEQILTIRAASMVSGSIIFSGFLSDTAPLIGLVDPFSWLGMNGVGVLVIINLLYVCWLAAWWAQTSPNEPLLNL